jgi:hypothetical protein
MLVFSAERGLLIGAAGYIITKGMRIATTDIGYFAYWWSPSRYMILLLFGYLSDLS